NKLENELRELKTSAARELNAEREKLGADISRLTREVHESELSLARERQDLIAQKENLENLRKELDTIHKKYTTEFEVIASKILEEKSSKFTEQNKTNLDIILNPLKERIKDFEAKVDKTYKAESDERISLKTEIKNLVELNTKISQEANNLATALKGDNKMQGNWGEVILEKILERSGLEKGREYLTQASTSNVDGDTIRPDVVVLLPDDKHLIIDSKVSLLAYEALVNATDEESRLRFVKAHLESLRAHIKGLGDKKYDTSLAFNTPDFVLLFLPIESSFSMAIQSDNDLFNYAWDKKVVLVSPSTLLATLRTIASMWKQAKQTANAMQIAEEGGKLYDKFVGFVEDLIAVGRKMDEAKGQYGEAMKKLSDGTGNLVGRAEKMRKLGAKVSKLLPPKLVERTEGDENA
ncbi:MAG TPA: DNA recombination protein RmuC, partial [Bacteroidia bacterium]|nr:DNA recombination protein RmuC [Bacteroidia bacterium]